MKDKELIDEIMTLIVAGHETTAGGLNCLWYLVSQHPAQMEPRVNPRTKHGLLCRPVRK